MARIAGADLPKNKRLVIALTYIFGVGSTRAKQICKGVGLDESLRTDKLTDEQVVELRNFIDGKFKVEGDLRREVGLSIKRLMDLGCYRGCLLYTSPSPRDQRGSRMPSSA